MKRANEILALAQQQRAILIECLLDEMKEDRVSDELKAAVAASDALIGVLKKICLGEVVHDGVA